MKQRQPGNEIWSVNNMRNTFVEKSYTKYAGEIIPRPLSKKSKLSISLNQ